MISIGRFLKSAGTYFLGNVLTRLISFFLLPVYTRFLAQEHMGYFDASTKLLNIIIPLVCLEVWSALMRFLFDFEDRNGKEKVIFNGFVIFAGSVAVYVLGFALLGFFVNIQCALLVLFYGFFLMIQNIYSYLARGMGHNQAFAVSGIVSGLINAASNVVMIVFLGMRLESLFLSMTLGLFVQFLILEGRVHALRALKVRYFDRTLILEMARFGLPLAVNNSCYWLLSGYNSIGISHTLGLDANGLYAVAGKFTMAVAIVANCFALAWQEMVYSVGNKKEDKCRLYSTGCDLCITLLLFGVMLIVPAVSVVFNLLVDESFSAAYSAVPLYMFATAISTFAGFLGNAFGAEKKTKSLIVSTVTAAAVNIATFHLLVGVLGIEAANVALTLGYIVIITIRWLQLRRLYPVTMHYGRILLLVVLCVPVFWLYRLQSIWVNFAIIAAVLLLALLVFRRDLKGLLSAVRARKGAAEKSEQ